MIYTWSKFNYGHTVDSSNSYIPFSEGADELRGTLSVGTFTLGEFAQEVEDALNAAGDLTYQVTLARESNKLTLSASGDFELLTHSSTVTATAFTLMGFDYSAADLTGEDTYSGNGPSGSEHFPQFLLQSYVAPEDQVESVDATVNKSSDGRVEVVRFGTSQIIEMDMKFITDLPMDGLIIRNNPNGHALARIFMGYIAQKKRFEFVPDVLTPDTYYKVILEKSPGYANGTGFKLKELFNDGLPGIFETGVLEMRVVT